jgi:hypothetical protein
MAKIVRHGSLEIDEDLTFQRRMWRARTAGKWLLIALVAAAAAGLFGKGPLSTGKVSDPDGRLTIEHERFARFQAPATLRFRFAPGAAREGKVRVWIERAFLEEIKIDTIVPEPEASELAGDRMRYTFAVAEGSAPSGGAIHFQPETIGRLGARAGLEGGAPVEFRQFIFP